MFSGLVVYKYKKKKLCTKTKIQNQNSGFIDSFILSFLYRRLQKMYSFPHTPIDNNITQQEKERKKVRPYSKLKLNSDSILYAFSTC